VKEIQGFVVAGLESLSPEQAQGALISRLASQQVFDLMIP
jgi:hypothetical protein